MLICVQSNQNCKYDYNFRCFYIRTKKFIFDILNKKNITIINSTHNHDDFDYDYHLKIDVSEESREIKIVK